MSADRQTTTSRCVAAAWGVSPPGTETLGWRAPHEKDRLAYPLVPPGAGSLLEQGRSSGEGDDGRAPFRSSTTMPTWIVGGLYDGSMTTRIAPLLLSAATRKASVASSSGNRWVITVCAIDGSSASMAATSSNSRTPSWLQ